jgi:hypothetical protein
MSACAGSLTNASRSHSARRRAERLSGVCGQGTTWDCFGPQEQDFKVFAGLVPMDRARQDWVYEHAETGWPLRSNDRNRSAEHAARLAACTLQGPCKPGKPVEKGERRSTHGGLPSVRFRPNGTFAGHGRPKHSATGYPQAAARSVFLPRLAAREAGSCAQAALQWLSAHPLSCHLRACPFNLAACTGCCRLPDGKVRWQRKFVFQARRMRRGLRF